MRLPAFAEDYAPHSLQAILPHINQLSPEVYDFLEIIIRAPKKPVDVAEFAPYLLESFVAKVPPERQKFERV
jgi:hypothetical protein